MSKKSGPAAPPPPDPTVVSNAQSAANIASAAAQQKMNMINTSGPSGSVNYEADPNAPGGYRQVTSLSQPQQAILDAQQRTQLGATNTAQDQLGRVNSALSQTLNTSSLPALVGSVGGGQGYGGAQGMGMAQARMGGGNQPDEFPHSSSQSSPMGGKRAATAPPSAQGPSSQSAPGMPSTDGIATSFDKGGKLQYGFDQGQSVQGHVGPTDLFGASRQAQDAAYSQAQSRLDPRFEQSENALRTQLANQGLSQNSSAYQTALQNFGQSKNDAYSSAQNQAVSQGNAAAQQLFDQSLQQGNFANAAAGQMYGQNQGQAAFNNQAAGQDYGQNLGAAQFGNAAQQQLYGQQLSNAQLGMNQQNQQFNQGLSNAQLSNSARGQGLQEQAYLQNQPLNQMSALLGMGQVAMPQGVSYTPSQVANTDVTGAYALQAQAQQAAAAQRAQTQSGMMNGLMSLGSAAIMASDRRLKTDIKLLRRRKDGVGVYSFRYRSGGPAQIGVMAQELKTVRPDLVIKRPDGMLAVNYAGLGAL